MLNQVWVFSIIIQIRSDFKLKPQINQKIPKQHKTKQYWMSFSKKCTN